MSPLTFIVYDAESGNGEDNADEKLVCWYPAEDQARMLATAGAAQGLRLFASRFSEVGDDPWCVTSTDGSTWLSYQAEGSICFLMIVPSSLLPRHCTEASLRGCLLLAHRLCCALHGSAALARSRGAEGAASLRRALAWLHGQLSAPEEWAAREARNPFSCWLSPSFPRQTPAANLALQRVVSTALEDLDAGELIMNMGSPLGSDAQHLAHPELLVALDRGVLWTSLPAEATARLSCVLATLPAAAGGGLDRGAGGEAGPGTPGAPSHSSATKPFRAALAGAKGRTPVPPALPWSAAPVASGGVPGAGRGTEPRLWLWLEPGDGDGTRGAGRSSRSSSATLEGVPRVHLPALGTRAETHGQASTSEASRMEASRPLLLLSLGRVLVALLPAASTTLSPALVTSLYARLAQPVASLIQHLKAEGLLDHPPGTHLPGFRYVIEEPGWAQISPRPKVSSMSHSSRDLAAAVRDSLLAGRARRGSAGRLRAVIARTRADCWALGIQDGDSHLLAIRERKGEKTLVQAAACAEKLLEQLPTARLHAWM